jgi:creatinine amidohydrolase
MNHTHYMRMLILFILALLTIGHSSVLAQILHMAELNTEQIRALDREKTIVLIPGGILEQHGPYLPSYTDGYRNEWAAGELSRAIAARPGWTALVFPTIPLGVGGANEIGGIFSFPGTYAVQSTTLRAIFVDLANELGEQGFKWIFVVHLHGAPAHSRVLDEAGDYFRDIYGGRMVHLYGLLPVLEAGALPLDPAEAAGSGLDVHAGRGETSDILFIRPDLVASGYETAPPLPGLSFDDLVRIAQSPDWPGYFSAPGQATAAEGKARLEQRTEAAAGLMWRIVDGAADEREIPRYAMNRPEASLRAARAAAAEERVREKRFAEWLAKRSESSQSSNRDPLPIIDMHLQPSRLANVEEPVGAALMTGPLAPGEHEVELRGINIWYLVRGRGPVLLIQPGGAGWGGDATIYVETFRPLEAKHTLVYYDPTGIGRSGRSGDPARYSLAEYVEDLEALRRHLGLDVFNLAGHSHGGSVALKYALAYPERVDRLLMLNSSGPFARDPDPEWLEAREGYGTSLTRWAAADTTLTPDELHAEFISSFVPALHFYHYEPVRQTVEELLARTTFSVEPFRQFEREIATFDIRDQVAGVRAPTLIVMGDDDPPDVREGSLLMHEHIPDAHLFVVPGCGHWPAIERPDLFFQAVLRFLAITR